MQQKNRGRLFSSEFYALDCSKARTRDCYANPAIQFDLVRKREREREDEIAQKAFLLTFAQKDF